MASFEEAMNKCKSQFKIQHLLKEQKEAIEVFFEKKKKIHKFTYRLREVLNLPVSTNCGRRAI